MAPGGTVRAHDANPGVPRHVIVVGHGMVGHRMVEALRARDTDDRWRVTVLAEEADAAYDRVGLTSYTETWDRAQLALPGNDYAGDERVRVLLNTRVTEIDRAAKSVVTADGTRHGYDALVLPPGPTPLSLRCPAMTCPAATCIARSMTSTLSMPAPNAHCAMATVAPAWSSAVAYSGWKPPTRCASSGCRRTSSR